MRVGTPDGGGVKEEYTHPTYFLVTKATRHIFGAKAVVKIFD